MCEKGFEGAQGLRKALEEVGEKLRGAFYGGITGEVFAVVVVALRKDLGGTIGHRYNCQNGHPVSFPCCSP